MKPTTSEEAGRVKRPVNADAAQRTKVTAGRAKKLTTAKASKGGRTAAAVKTGTKPTQSLTMKKAGKRAVIKRVARRKVAMPMAGLDGRPVGRRERAKHSDDMKNATLHLRLKEGLKEQATAVLSQLGISVPEAIRVFLARIVSEGQLPFEVEIPNEATRHAMQEARQCSGRFSTAEELFDDLDAGTAYKARRHTEVVGPNQDVRR